MTTCFRKCRTIRAIASGISRFERTPRYRLRRLFAQLQGIPICHSISRCTSLRPRLSTRSADLESDFSQCLTRSSCKKTMMLSRWVSRRTPSDRWLYRCPRKLPSSGTMRPVKRSFDRAAPSGLRRTAATHFRRHERRSDLPPDRRRRGVFRNHFSGSRAERGRRRQSRFLGVGISAYRRGYGPGAGTFADPQVMTAATRRGSSLMSGSFPFPVELAIDTARLPSKGEHLTAHTIAVTCLIVR